MIPTAANNQTGSILIFMAVVVAALFAAGSLSVAASKSAPGDALYSLGKAVDTARVTLAFGDTNKAAAHLDMAEKRLQQVQELETEGTTTEHLTEAIARAEHHQVQAQAKLEAAVQKGQDVEELARRLENIALRQQSVLRQAMSKAPDATREALQQALNSAQAGIDTARQYLESIPGVPLPGNAQ